MLQKFLSPDGRETEHCHPLDENGYLPASILKQAAAHKIGSEPTVKFTGHSKRKRNSPIKRQLQGYPKNNSHLFFLTAHMEQTPKEKLYNCFHNTMNHKLSINTSFTISQRIGPRRQMWEKIRTHTYIK